MGDPEVKQDEKQQSNRKGKKPKGGNPGRSGPRKPQQATHPIKAPAAIAEQELDPPSKLKENKARQPTIKTTDESLVSESAFEPDTGFSCVSRELRFTPSATGWTAVNDVIFTELRNDKGLLVAKELPREAFRYYTACLFWLRVIGLKAQLGDQLSRTEVDIQRTFTNQVLAVPEPIHLGLKTLGRTKTKNGEIISPEFPSTPNTVTANTPGGLGLVTADNHNIYEDLPIIGPAFQACYERAADQRAVNYISAFQPAHGTAKQNLQGFGPLAPARMEAISLLNEMGFSLDDRPLTIGNSGINYNAVKTVSNLISRITRFKMIDVDILAMPPTGSIAQVIQARPVAQDLNDINRAILVTMSPQCASSKSKMHLGVNLIFGLNQWKENTRNGNHPDDIQSWSCITWEADHIPVNFIERRNARRNFPDLFNDRVFRSVDMNPHDLRVTTISKLAKLS